ncbi:hypothetical protein C8J57DRAFT_1726336 [Mycena rebaudengoi]|nr:hypothetical protein C8J57DRAFT_1726336 [Mycena rebaudengoi]
MAVARFGYYDVGVEKILCRNCGVGENGWREVRITLAAPKPALIYDGPSPSPRAGGIPIRAHPPLRPSCSALCDSPSTLGARPAAAPVSAVYPLGAYRVVPRTRRAPLRTVYLRLSADFARDSPSPHTQLSRKTIQRPQSKLSPSTIVARSPQAAHTRLCAALYRTSKRHSASVAIYLLRCITTPNGTISKRLHFILLVPGSISAFQSDYMFMLTSAACVILRSHR